MNRNFTATVLIVLSIGIYFTVTRGIMAEASKVQTVNAEYVKAIESAKATIEVRDQLQNAYANLSADDKDHLAKIVPTSVDNIRLIIDMKEVAAKYGLNLKDAKADAGLSSASGGSGTPPAGMPLPPASGIVISDNSLPTTMSGPIIPESTLDSMSVSFSVSAPYQQFVSFLQDVEASIRIMDVTGLSVETKDNGVYEWKVQMKTYWLKNP